MDLMKTDWKKIERAFAGHVTMGYRNMRIILILICDGFCEDETIEDFSKVEQCAIDHGAKDYSAAIWENEIRLMSQLTNNEPEFVQRTADWLLSRPLPKLLAHHVHGLREIKGLNRKISKLLKRLSKRPMDDDLDKLKEKMANLKKMAFDQMVALACLDYKLEDLPKIGKKTKIVLSKMAEVTVKALKSFRCKRFEQNSETSDAENAGSSDEGTGKEAKTSGPQMSPSLQVLYTSHDSPPRGDLRETGDSAPQGDDPPPGESFPKITMVKPLNADGDVDFDHQGEIENISDVKKEISPINVDRNGPEMDRKEEGKTDHGEEQAAKASPADNLPGMVRKFAWSEEPRPIPEVTNTSIDQDAAEQGGMASRDLLPLGEMYETYVRVIRKYKAKNKHELSLKVGQIVKQKCQANADGYAYGWTRAHRLAPKRRGRYPVDCVQLKSQAKQ